MGHFDRQEHLGALYLSSRHISPGNLQIFGEQRAKVKEKMGHAKYFVCKKNCLGDISLKIVTYLALFLSHEHFRIWVTCAVVKTTSANNNVKLNVIKTVLFEGCLGRKL